MSEAHAGPWPLFRLRWRGQQYGWDPIRWMRVAAERGGGRGRPRAAHRGAGPPRFSGDSPSGGPFGFPFSPFGDPRRGRGRFWGGPKVRRGDVRASVLALLAEQPRNGYQIIQEIAERSGGLWRPSAGSVYPALQQLEDEGLIRAVEAGARRLFELTEEGRRYVQANPDECAAPWEAVSDTAAEQARELRELIGGVAAAAAQVLHAGSAAQAAEARRILTDARRSLYRILAEDDSDDNTG